jgi:hypothetical protein
LYKRHLVYQTVRSVIELLNKAPDAIAIVVKHSRLWASADGDLDSTAFREVVRAQGLNPRRFFSNDGELIHADGRTYAFTNQWGLNTIDAMESLVKACPELKIEFHQSASEE